MIFVARKDATGKQGIIPLQSVVAAIRMLAYGIAADALDAEAGWVQRKLCHYLPAEVFNFFISTAMWTNERRVCVLYIR